MELRGEKKENYILDTVTFDVVSVTQGIVWRGGQGPWRRWWRVSRCGRGHRPGYQRAAAGTSSYQTTLLLLDGRLPFWRMPVVSPASASPALFTRRPTCRFRLAGRAGHVTTFAQSAQKIEKQKKSWIYLLDLSKKQKEDQYFRSAFIQNKCNSQSSVQSIRDGLSRSFLNRRAATVTCDWVVTYDTLVSNVSG